MGAKQSCAKRLEEPAREHRTFDLLVPTGVSEGDELKFRTAAGPYGLRVPEGVTPGRKLQVTVTVPEGFSKLLVVEGLTVNGTPCPTVEESQRAAEEAGRLVMLAPVLDYVRGAGVAADRKVSEAANKCIGFGHGVVRVYLAEEEPPGQVVGNPRWINGRMSIQPKDTSAMSWVHEDRKEKEAKAAKS